MEEENSSSSTKLTKNRSLFGLFDDNSPNSTNSTHNASDLRAFLKNNYHNRLTLLSNGNFVVLKRPALVFFHQFKEKYVELKAWIDFVYEIAVEFTPESIQFAVADFEELATFYANWNDLDFFGFDADMPPYVYAVDPVDRQFQYEGNVTYDDLIKYTQQIIDNKLWRTQPMPEETDVDAGSNIRTIVASNFEKCVFENEKDVVVTFHSNFSLQYKSDFMGVPKELIDDADNLIFYSYNAQENYVPLECRIRELPTSMLIPRNAKRKRLLFVPDKYNIALCHCDMGLRAFLAANVTTELKMFERNGHPKDFEAAKQKNLGNFLKENYDNRIQTLSHRNYHSLKRPLLVFYHNFDEQFLQLKEWIDLLFEIEKQFSDSIQFVLADFDNLSFFHKTLDDVNLFGVEHTSSPYVFALDAGNHDFEYNGPITSDALTQYCEVLSNNKLWKTEPIPDEIQNCKTVHTIVASNLWGVILGHEKDCLVTFYKSSSTWKSTINQVIEELECDLDKIAFYKFNVDENYLPLALQIDNFPTSMFVPCKDKFKKLFFNHSDHLVYDNFTHPYYEDLVAFLAKNASTELTYWNRKGQRNGKNVARKSDE